MFKWKYRLRFKTLRISSTMNHTGRLLKKLLFNFLITPFRRLSTYIADPRQDLKSADLWQDFRDIKIDGVAVPFVMCLRWVYGVRGCLISSYLKVSRHSVSVSDDSFVDYEEPRV